MGSKGQLRKVEVQLSRELKKTTVSFFSLGKQYGVSRQAISRFCQSRGIRRPKRDYMKECPICQGLIKISREPHSDFISSRTIMNRLGIGQQKFLYHMRILREKGLISQKFGKLHSQKAEQAYQIYSKERLPVRIVGRKVGYKNFASIVQKHRMSGRDVPGPLFIYHENNPRRKKRK
jgi:hypothetical protein